MTNQEHFSLIKQGTTVWNAWRRDNPNVFPDLRGANLYRANLGGADLSRADLRAANFRRADLNLANLQRANLQESYLAKTDLSNAVLCGADLRRAYLRGAILRKANLSTNSDRFRTILRKANLSEADLRNANLAGADLNGASLVEAKCQGADLTGCYIYGISAWNVELEGAKQQNLVITNNNPGYNDSRSCYGDDNTETIIDKIEPRITVDSIEVAQFIYLLLQNKKIRDIIDTITTKVVLILGRFTIERKAILDALCGELRKRDRTPIVFDFDQPGNKNITDTVKLLAQMARYIIVDLSDPNSAPYELGVISMLGLDSTPVVPLIAGEQQPFPMLVDILQKHWSTQLVRYQDLDDLKTNLDENLIKIAEVKVQKLQRGM